jgi:hypothetical protein
LVATQYYKMSQVLCKQKARERKKLNKINLTKLDNNYFYGKGLLHSIN